MYRPMLSSYITSNMTPLQHVKEYENSFGVFMYFSDALIYEFVI